MLIHFYFLPLRKKTAYHPIVMKHIIPSVLLGILLLSATGCADKSRRSEIAQRKAALQHKQDSALAAAQQELALVDSALQASRSRHDQLLQQLHAGGMSSQAMQQLGRQITAERLHRDSLQVRFDVLCAQIKYIHRKQAERQAEPTKNE